MVELILSIVILFLGIVLLGVLPWWAEAKYNFINRIVTCLKRACDWIKAQTKLKIDICKWLLNLIIILIVFKSSFFLLESLYIPYFKEVTEFQDGAIKLTNKETSSSQKEDLILKNYINDDEQKNVIGDWGTFGDFIGGTLNPIIGFISILLLFATWKLTRKTLDFTKQELKNSNELLLSQQFDSLFFSVLQQLKDFEKILTDKNDKNESMLDEIYHNVFYKKFDYILSCKREILKQYEALNQYFICLFQLYKMVNNIFEVETKDYLRKCPKTFSLEKKYSNILRSIVPMKLQQLLFLNISEEFELYEDYLNYYSFFKHMSFSRLDNHKGLNVDIIALAENLKKSYKEESKNFLMVSESIHYSKLKESIFFKLKENNCSFLNGFDLIREKLKLFRKVTAFYANKNKIYETDGKYDYVFLNFDEATVLCIKKEIFVGSLESSSNYSNNISYADVFYELDGLRIAMDSISYFIYIQETKIIKVEKILEENLHKISTARFITDMLLDTSPTFIDVEKNPL